jgi:hypothetical protein
MLIKEYAVDNYSITKQNHLMIIFFDQAFPFLKYSYHTIIKAVWKTRTFKPVEYGSIHHQGRLEDGYMNSWRAFKPPGWIRTRHIMASERREVK